jgi:signal transduction histidine kinase
MTDRQPDGGRRLLRMMKILVVDGSKQQRHDIVEALARLEDIAVQGAVPDVRSALPVLAGDTPDVVVVGGAELRDAVTGLVDDAAGDERLALLGRMTGGAIHDLNNYLALIDGTVHLLAKTPADTSLLDQLRRGVALATRLTGTLLIYARGEVPTFASIDLGALVRSTLDLARSSVSDMIDVIDDVDADLAPVRGVKSELEQLVINLVLNAADAMPSGGELRVRVRGQSGSIVLEVADSGDGITMPGLTGPEIANRPRRLGLGLGIVRRVAARHRATLRFTHGIPSGTVVTVVFSSQQ